ncbi:MAG: hypothetical protein M3Z04_13970 [Chloroflexota bacterium]|nr:hypothetical protein [Chloroflexota bacterium]
MRKPYIPKWKPDPPPKPRYKARQDPLRVFVTFTVADGAGVLVQRGVVQVADYLAARRWARQVFSYGLELRGAGWVQYIAPHTILSIEHLDTDRPYREQIDQTAGAWQLEDVSPALIGVALDAYWANRDAPEVVIIEDAAFAAAVLAAHTGAPPTEGRWQPKGRGSEELSR